MESSQVVVTRFAPSPTGKAHAGGYRTAMYAWLFARQQGGKFILRIEDTDRARNVLGAKEDIFQALEWLGINHDQMYIQSENIDRHKEILNKLIQENKAYISPEEAKDGSGVIKELVRFRNPKKIISFIDLIRGAITIDTTDLGDFILARSIDDPVYHLAVVVDDHDEGVTHVIRAEEHIANTPRHILIHEALGWDIPKYAHLPLVLSQDRKKLSKRKGALPMTDYAKMGYLPEAVFNCISMLGWNPADPGSAQELFSISELIKRFDFARMQKSGAVFNPEKLDWFNREYIKKLPSEEFLNNVRAYLSGTIVVDTLENRETLKKIELLIRDRIVKFSDIHILFGREDGSSVGEFDYFFITPIFDKLKIVWKNDTLEQVIHHIGVIKEILGEISDNDWTKETIKVAVWNYAEKEGRGNVLWPFRVALSGREKSPDPFELSYLLGKEVTLARLQKAIE